MMDRTFDWTKSHDARNQNYPVQLTADEPRSYTWRCDTWLDQGREGSCVGHGVAHEIAARPKVYPVSSELAVSIYREAQTIDEWPGESYEGTSVLAGVKVAQRRGYYSGYRWAFNLNDALVAISRQGPAVIGVPWYQGMFNTDAKGFISPTGDILGGHCVVVTGVNVTAKIVRIHNSWGKDWGIGGDALLSWDNFGSLLTEGECCLPVRI